MAIVCRVREIRQHEFTHANQIHEIWLTSGAHSSKSDAHGVAIVWKYRDEAFIWCMSGLHSTLRSCATGAWIWPSSRSWVWHRLFQKALMRTTYPWIMCIPGAQESVQLSRLLNALPSLRENAVNSGLTWSFSDMARKSHNSDFITDITGRSNGRIRNSVSCTPSSG